MRRLITALLALAIAVCIFLPSARYTEDEDSVLLARTIYALGKNESYQTKLKLGSVVMNRLENDWFPDDLGEVLSDPQQFPAGSRYDAIGALLPAVIEKAPAGRDFSRRVDALPPEVSAIIRLRFYEEQSLAEISRILDCPLSTVKTRLYTGLKKLRIAVEGEV